MSGSKLKIIKFLAKLTNLTLLDLSWNQIVDISPLVNLVKLQDLNLGHNDLTDIDCLRHLPALRKVKLHNNSISNIDWVRGNESLHSLDLANNYIADLNPAISILRRESVISFNQDIKDVTYSVNVYNNPIKTPPLHIVKQGADAVLTYFDAGDLIPLNECKVIFVGDGGVGKTCLMKTLAFDVFDPKENQTHGINKIAWKEFLSEKNEVIKINLWDFGGQDIQHSLHQFFFTERVIYVLVVDPRNDTRGDYWIEQIEKLGSNSEVLIVYNWKDPIDIQANFLVKFYELRKKYAKLDEPSVLSVKTGEGLKEFKQLLHVSILRNEGMVQEYPNKWFKIKQKLEEIVAIGQENYIYYETYQKWCREYDYAGPDKQRTLLKILNKIGAIVYFDRPVLNRNTILNPEWITTGAYAILTSPITNAKKGHLTEADLVDIFREEKEIFSNKQIKLSYDQHQFQYIIQLMIEYNLCHENPIVNNEYLIPSAFGSSPLSNFGDHKATSRNYRIQFESPFEMLIMHRFIAKNLYRVVDKNYWHSGIFLKDLASNTFALVETNQHSFRIDFWLKGESILMFWEAIRRDFGEIFSMYTKFIYKEEVLYTSGESKVYLPYDEMLNSLKNSVKIIDYHPSYQIKNIDVEKILGLFE
jgi:internalin A